MWVVRVVGRGRAAVAVGLSFAGIAGRGSFMGGCPFWVVVAAVGCGCEGLV
jgi:hypothetical protein